MTRNEKKAAAERERKARIRRASELLAALPADEQEHVREHAERMEAAAAEAGAAKRAGVSYLEDALVHWRIGGELTALAVGGTPTPDRVDAIVEAADREIRGEHALGAIAVADFAAARAEEPQVDVPAEIRRLRAEGLTIAEVATRVGIPAADVREVLGDDEAAPAKRAQRPAAAKRETRELGGGVREEKCPDCGEWRPAALTATGEYEKSADYRKGRRDCRACYNRRWREAQERRKNPAAA